MAGQRKTTPSKAIFSDEKVLVGTGGEVHQVASGDVPPLTTQQGMPVSDDQNSLRAGARAADSPSRSP
mgnify:CR=1 FL=1